MVSEALEHLVRSTLGGDVSRDKWVPVPCKNLRRDQVMKILRKRAKGSGFCNSIHGGPPLCHNNTTETWTIKCVKKQFRQ